MNESLKKLLCFVAIVAYVISAGSLIPSLAYEGQSEDLVKAIILASFAVPFVYGCYKIIAGKK